MKKKIVSLLLATSMLAMATTGCGKTTNGTNGESSPKMMARRQKSLTQVTGLMIPTKTKAMQKTCWKMNQVLKLKQ